MTEERDVLIENFLKRYGIEFVDHKLFEISLTHRSYVYESEEQGLEDNERLEFFGDAVIGAVVALYLYQHLKQASVGELSKLRSRIVSRAMLGRRAKEMALGELMLLGRGEEQTGGRQRSSVIGAGLEAVVGTIYLSGGMEKTQPFILTHIITPALQILDHEDYIDFKSRLQEVVQQHFHTVPEYRVAAVSGPEHNKWFSIEVWIKDKKLGTGEGKRKKSAENSAAKEAYKKLLKELNTPGGLSSES